MSKRPASRELAHDPKLARKFSHFDLQSDSNILPAQSFALCILDYRDLAKYVRKVTLTYSLWGQYEEETPPYEAVTPEDKVRQEIFRAAIADQDWDESDASGLLNRLMTTERPDINQRSFHQNFPDAAGPFGRIGEKALEATLSS
ncbi:hypothetical protein VTL71DRAFT_12970 [Oculimacula yallundae]|uniref:Uncharacterized protein n=1 Tax=Oculimacula yallundae TaxID=86028 RepID=A0ABR4CP34_9HELO